MVESVCVFTGNENPKILPIEMKFGSIAVDG
jgi:hypothetical protein